MEPFVFTHRVYCPFCSGALTISQLQRMLFASRLQKPELLQRTMQLMCGRCRTVVQFCLPDIPEEYQRAYCTDCRHHITVGYHTLFPKANEQEFVFCRKHADRQQPTVISRQRVPVEGETVRCRCCGRSYVLQLEIE